MIAALSAFDIVYVATDGGPGFATLVPGIQIYILAFLERQVGRASALAVVLCCSCSSSSSRSSAWSGSRTREDRPRSELYVRAERSCSR